MTDHQPKDQYLLGCDWGSSSFRLRLFNISSEKIEAEVQADNGVTKMNRHWNYLSTNDQSSRELFFRKELKKQLGILSSENVIDYSGVSIIMSGMASSSIGMRNVAYALTPFSLEGTDAHIELIESDAELPHDIVLVSGVRTTLDVMRGEETQLLGLTALLKSQYLYQDPSIFILPGTHSKHVYVRNNSIVDFKTFITGEIYQVLSQYSILKDSVDDSGLVLESERDMNAFRKGVQASSNGSLLQQLFSIRTNQLFGLLEKKHNSYYMSGVLVGSELRSLLNEGESQFFLCSSEKLHAFYKLALDELGLLSKTVILPTGMMDQATIFGQWIMNK